MTRYLLYLREGTKSVESINVDDGATLDHLRLELLRFASEVIKDLEPDFLNDPQLSIWLTDESGARVLALNFTVEPVETVSGRSPAA